MTFSFTVKGKTALLDIEDAQRLFGRSVRMVGGGYLMVKVGPRYRLLHRYLMGLKTGDQPEVDHINGDRADNRRENLRLATRSQNATNRRGVNGVYWCKNRERWCAHIAVNKKRMSLGRFVRQEDALAARIAAEQKYQGEFAGRVSRGN